MNKSRAFKQSADDLLTFVECWFSEMTRYCARRFLCLRLNCFVDSEIRQEEQYGLNVTVQTAASALGRIFNNCGKSVPRRLIHDGLVHVSSSAPWRLLACE